MRIYSTVSDGVKVIDSKFLLNAYCNGLFPMADGKDGEIRWFDPERRGVIPLEGLIISRSLRRTIVKNTFEIRVNYDFERTIRSCADRSDVWISEMIVQSYVQLHRMGYAHSVEAWSGGTLAGGLYGVSINGAFFGESMFSTQSDASKCALVYLVERMTVRGYALLDTQYSTPHLASLGGIEISREEYLRRLDRALQLSCSFV